MALVAERQKNGVYLGRTVLTMSMAYIDARLLCRPSSEWLDTEVIRASWPMRRRADFSPTGMSLP